MRGRPNQLILRSHHTFSHRKNLFLSYILDFFVSFLLETEVWSLHFGGNRGGCWWWGVVCIKNLSMDFCSLSEIYRQGNSTSVFLRQFHVSVPLTITMFLLVFHMFFRVILAFFFFWSFLFKEPILLEMLFTPVASAKTT